MNLFGKTGKRLSKPLVSKLKRGITYQNHTARQNVTKNMERSGVFGSLIKKIEYQENTQSQSLNKHRVRLLKKFPEGSHIKGERDKRTEINNHFNRLIEKKQVHIRVDEKAKNNNFSLEGITPTVTLRDAKRLPEAAHELTHSFDYLRGKLSFPNNLNEVAHSEVRAGTMQMLVNKEQAFLENYLIPGGSLDEMNKVYHEFGRADRLSTSEIKKSHDEIRAEIRQKHHGIKF
jgi:hypothetical protein